MVAGSREPFIYARWAQSLCVGRGHLLSVRYSRKFALGWVADLSVRHGEPAPVGNMRDVWTLTYDPLAAPRLLTTRKTLYTYTGNDPIDMADPTGNDSFVVARLLDSPVGYAFVGHAFVVTNARYVGDPQARIYSFGKLANGNMGNVSDPSRAADISAPTSHSDAVAWANLGVRAAALAANADISRVDAPDDIVDKVAQSVSENRTYALIPITKNEANSNSAAFAVGDEADQIAKKSPNAHVDRTPFNLALPGQSSSPRVDFKSGACGGAIGASCKSGTDIVFWN